MQNETRNCQNCKTDFVIEAEDFAFYEKIDVPAPTFCPECRLQRRLAWMKGIQLFKRPCDLCKKDGLSMYHADAPYTVYCHSCWWSDDWDAGDYGMEYDSNKTFFEQWNELLHRTPLLGLSVDSITGQLSPYVNHAGYSKNCYLMYYSNHCENVFYTYYSRFSKNIFNSACVFDSENCFDCQNTFKSNGIIRAQGNVTHSLDCAFVRDCTNAQNCFASANIRNGQYYFFNQKLSKEQYQEKMSEIDLGSYAMYEEMKQQVQDHFKQFPPKPTYDDFSENVTGTYVFESQNCKECYDVTQCKDSKFLMLIKQGKVEESYDYTDWGANASRMYECMTVGENCNNVRFCEESGMNLADTEYSKLATGGSNQFGCISVKKGEYWILNKRYAKEEYYKLREKIIADMNSNPYISKAGHVYKYGEFFPPEFSVFGYNDSFASRLFPMKENDAVEHGWNWQEFENTKHTATISAALLPDHIKDVEESILKEVIGCKDCGSGFRVVRDEFDYLKQKNLPLPRTCPFCRVWEKVDAWTENMKLYERTCDGCAVSFQTHYTAERAPHILCKDCYQKEVI